MGPSGSKQPKTISVASWNILADGLSLGEFMSSGGDEHVYWINRRDNIANCMGNLLQKCHVVVTQENDHPTWILEKIQGTHPSIRMSLRKESGKTAKKIYVNRLSKALVEGGHYSLEGGCDLRADDEQTNKNYEKMNSFLMENKSMRDALMRQGLTCTTNEEENFQGYGDTAAVTINPANIYRAHECLAVYYDSSKVEIVSESKLTDPIYQIEMRLVDDPSTSFVIFPAHLKSGESLKDERKRVKELKSILEAAELAHNPIVVMDSNHSAQYEETILQTELQDSSTTRQEEPFVSTIMGQHGFVDIVQTSFGGRNENFKMRHAQGAQKSKFGNLMFDVIDKILIPKTFQYEPLDLPDAIFQRYPMTDNYHDILSQLRNNAPIRQALRKLCIDRKWGPDMRYNDCPDDDVSLQECGFDKDIIEKIKREGGLKAILLSMYPNVDSPSDHPPVGATIYLD